jgi:hypothetical protein
VSNPINWKKGLLRLWLVLSILWGFGVAAVVFGMSQEKEELLYYDAETEQLIGCNTVGAALSSAPSPCPDYEKRKSQLTLRDGSEKGVNSPV